MAGSDTFRGCSFQAAYCVGLSLDVLEGDATALILEGNADVVDAALEDDGRATRVVQAKTKVEPYVWGPQEIADVLTAWTTSYPDPEGQFEFVTDGSLGPTVQVRLAPALRHCVEQIASDEDRAYIKSLDLDPDSEALKHVTLHSRVPGARTLLEQATLRVLELRERVAPLTVEDARDVVLRLFGEVVITSGEQEVEQRRVEREQIAEIVGVPLAAIDDAELWSEDAETRHREALSASRPDPAWTLLDLLPAEHPVVLTFVIEQGPEAPAIGLQAATSLLDREDDVFLQGPAGAGKTTTLAQLRSEGLKRGLLVISIRVGSYVAGSLEHLVRRSLERSSGRPLAPGVVLHLLDREGTLVFLDGVGELLAEQRQALIDDLQRLRERHVCGRFILAGRDPAPFARSALTGFVVQGLDSERRREIAAACVEGGDRFVPEIEDRIGEASSNPLLFAMAIGLYARGRRPSSRSELFEGFTHGLQDRPEGLTLSNAARGAAEFACFDLRSEGRFSAERWWWLDKLTDAREVLVSRGTVAGDAPSAEQLLDEIVALGLMQTLTDSGDIGLLHDLFSDWLASEAMRHGLREFPSEVDEPLEEAVVFLAERNALDDTQLLRVASNAVAAARAADVHPADAVDPELANELWRKLNDQLGSALRDPLQGLVLRVIDGEPPVVCLTDPATDDETEMVLRSPVVCLALGPVSSLSVSVDLWLAALRLTLQEEPPEMPTREARSAEDLAALIEDAVHARAAAVVSFLEASVPGLADRMLRQIGPSGLRGWLLPATSHPVYPGSPESIEEHLLQSTPVADGVHIQCVSDAEEIPKDEVSTRSIAESHLRTAPRQQARSSVIGALEEIVPRFGA